MNQLNSIILEGCISNDPFIDSVKCSYGFNVVNQRTFKNNNDKKWDNEYFKFPIIVYSKRLADLCYRKAQPGRFVRIVGRVVMVVDKMYVVADHLDFKYTKGKEDECED